MLHHVLVVKDCLGTRVAPLEASSYFIGRDPRSSIIINSEFASQQHAIILRISGSQENSFSFVLIDGNLQGKRSTNGSYVNGEKCVSKRLQPNDNIRFASDVTAKYITLNDLSDQDFKDYCAQNEPEKFLNEFGSSQDPKSTMLDDLPSPSNAAEDLSILRLASFPEIIPIPMFEVTVKGQLTYLNPAAIEAFPDLPLLGLDHPIVSGLLDQLAQTHYKAWSREVKVGNQIFEQSVHFLSENGLIRCILFDITERVLSESKYVGAELSQINLEGKDFSKKNISFAKFRNSNLRQSNFTLSIAIATDFTGADFTGACIEHWNINSETKFRDVKCEYIYLKANQEERSPLEGNFQPGEFTALVSKAVHTVDLIFVDGLNWEAFFVSFQELRSQFSNDEISIQAIERKYDSFVIRLETSSQADRKEIEVKAKELYKTQLKLQKAEGKIEGLQEQLAKQRESHSDVLEMMVKNMAEKNGVTQNFHAPVGNVAGKNEGDMKAIQHNYASDFKQTPAESAKEIQDLLLQLQQTNPTDIQSLVEQRIKSDPTLRQRIKNALKEGGLETMKIIFPLAGIAIETVRGWVEAKGD